MLPLALLIAANASESACEACCRAGGLATCEPGLTVYGDGSRLSRDGSSWRIAGVWEIGCDGTGRFDPARNVLLDHPPLGGELVMDGVSPLQVHCFQQACARPPGTCLSPADDQGRFFLLECGTGLPADAAVLGRVPPPDRVSNTQVVMLDGRPLVVQPVKGGATSGASSAAAVPYAPPAPTYTPPAPTYTAPAPTYTPPAPTYTPPAPTYTPPASTPSPAATTSAAGDAFASIAASLPKDPPDTCKPPGDALRAEARKRVDTGDERRIRKDAAGALQEYRAALTMDTCNAYAWLGIGEVASEAPRPDLAVRALRNATRLLPAHYGAWTQLGKNYESLRQSALAAEAYQKALDLRPGLPEALDGWRRTAAP